jgi:hypothetical protein
MEVTMSEGNLFMERRDIIVTRVEFLRTVHDICLSGDTRPILFLDKRWVNQNHSLKYLWQDYNTSGELKMPVGERSRVINSLLLCLF